MRRNVGRKPQTSANLAAFLHITTTSRLLAPADHGLFDTNARNQIEMF
jgi:hypothetical protein